MTEDALRVEIEIVVDRVQLNQDGPAIGPIKRQQIIDEAVAAIYALKIEEKKR